ncbi:MAG: hypothetical protein ACOVO2_15145 [Emticicia sp.]|uniref:hypothetical protein n=1 Tax=Emticicia sp. TaxID=1930953 RepID=UPI003BA74983
MSQKKINLLFIAITIFLPIVYGVFFIRNFSMPLSGGGDVDEWEYVGYYLSQHLSFKPFPSLVFNHNQTFYPFGTTQVFSDWSLESNYWFAFFYNNFGHGAWLNYYYILSLIVSFLGSYLILKRDFGQTKAFFVGFIVTFFNFYALNKYPNHYNHSTIHWAILSLFTDFILVKRIILKENISLKWVYLKVFILLATLGMNLGYICGFALNSFVISLIAVILIIVKRIARGENQLKKYLIDWYADIKRSPMLYLTLSLPSLIFMFLYLPLVLQIYFEAKSFHLDDVNAPHFWSHPLRMLLPYFPNFSALHNPFTYLLNDMPEGLGSGSPGWVCLSLGIIGFFSNRKQFWLVFLPLIILLLISTFYHPNKIPTLKIFPWGAYNRVPSRFTSLLPVIFSCFFLPTDVRKIPYNKFFLVAFTTFFVLELSVVYKYRYTQKPFEFEKNFFGYMQQVKMQKGEAVMDFPFCIVGGDGTGLRENLCPIFQRTCNVYALSRFHEKKVIGGYYSHVHDSAIKGFVGVGIGNWATPNDSTYIEGWKKATKIINAFNDQQLEHFIKYFQYNDFAGINVCVDLIPTKMYQQITSAMGQPTQSTIFPGAGKVVFIPKPKDWQILVNKEKAKQLKFPCGCE